MVEIAGRKIGVGQPTFIIAEMSGNHNMEYERAVELVKAAKYMGVDAIKIQTYTADTITLNSDKPWFMAGNIWEGTTLYKLYEQAYTPWEWQPKLKELADSLGIILFSSPFDLTAVDFLEKMNVEAYKIASYEITDIPLIKRTAKTGKPIIMSTGIATKEDIELAIQTCKEEGNEQIILLKCTSEYPAVYADMNLARIRTLREDFACEVGLSDHSMGDEIAIAAVAMGASVIEKHFTIARADGGVDSSFSMEIEEMKAMVDHIRHVEAAIGNGGYELNERLTLERRSAKSLMIAKDIKQGECFTRENIRCVRPGVGMHPKFYEQILGKKATRDLNFADPLKEEDVDWNNCN